ncbi:MAG TPA: peroxide stress protein YaaA [Jatrophihabitans sp.]|nr:peroxide stress protein YaaA [Jatrophihabitans sp.]
MRILLPPSEAKHPGGRGRSLRSAGAGRDEVSAALFSHREQVLAALAALVDRPDAAAALLLPPSVAEAALATNRRAADAPTRPALQRYAGVVYDGLAVAGLSEAALRRARTGLLIFSGLLGVSRGGDPVPDYRVPAKAVLPGLGIAGTYWRPRLATVLPALLDRGPIVDLRSSDYAAMWKPRPGSAEADRLIGVRVLSATPAGRLAVVSYPSKLAKGRLAAALLERQAAGEPVTGADDVLTAWAKLGGRDGRPAAGGVELIE